MTSTGLAIARRVVVAAVALLLGAAAMLLRYANVIFDLDRAAALATVHAYLDDLGIAYCGRYGDWGYMWTDESFKSGELAAQRALTSLGRSQAGLTQSV